MGIADAIDAALTGQQNPNLTHTFGSTMTSLALALILGADDISDIEGTSPGFRLRWLGVAGQKNAAAADFQR